MTRSTKTVIVIRIHWTGGGSMTLIGGGIDAEPGTSPISYLCPRGYSCSDVMPVCFLSLGLFSPAVVAMIGFPYRRPQDRDRLRYMSGRLCLSFDQVTLEDRVCHHP
ncbi:hypothetical protein BJX96DRAFT_151229 [Aspergillus floccosus]